MLLILGLCGQSVFLKVPHFHRPEETLHARALFTEPGGKGYNQAIAARRMGAQVLFAGAIGADGDGACCRDRLEKEGISSRFMIRKERTAYAVILTDDRGENRVTVYPGAALLPEDISQMGEAFDRAQWLLLTPEIPEPVFAKAMEMARERKLRVIVNPAPFVPYVEKYLGEAWCITPNRSEARAMLGLSSAEPLLPALKKAPFPRMVVTLGAEGAALLEKGECHLLPAPRVEAVDTTGAGDCFNGVLCACLMQGMPLKEAAEYAVRGAAFSVKWPHVLDGMPYPKDVEEMK